MEERQVTLDGHTYPLERPFMVVATQNPIEHEGTYPLPEAELDRFLMRVRIGYPDPKAEIDVLSVHGLPGRLEEVEPVDQRGERPEADRARTHRARRGRASRSTSSSCSAGTREHEHAYLGASPRAGLMLQRAARVARRRGRTRLRRARTT